MKKVHISIIIAFTLVLTSTFRANPEYDPTDLFPSHPEGYGLTISGQKHFLLYSIFGKKRQISPAVITNSKEDRLFDVVGPEIGSRDGIFRFKPKVNEFVLEQYSIYLYSYERDEITLVRSEVPREIFLQRSKMRNFIENELINEFQPDGGHNSGSSAASIVTP
ncbi:hypothetical protein JIN87_28030 [Pelagicoccus mobilis]|uniref:DUF2846 domain-containing protein n=2 Tax=Pelagicoccus mobilis TaxID=415221 RepID=A0A934S7G7_9BACT|nr:hypothetical protein [Pelagicoccus mobilis]